MNINSAELETVLSLTPVSHNIMLVGKHGVGKSEIITNHYQKNGLKVVPLFLGQMSDPGDLIGLPRFDESSGRTIFAPPFWYPTDGQPIVLFLDELNRARNELLQAVMDLTLNRTIAGHKLPQGSRVVAAVNYGDEYQLTDMDPALVSRFDVYYFRPTVKEWIQWGKKNGIDARVIDFISLNNDYLEGLPDTKKKDSSIAVLPNRRAWVRVSNCIIGQENVSRVQMKMIAAIIGDVAAAVFAASLHSSAKMNVEDVLDNYDDQESKADKLSFYNASILNEQIFNYIEANGISQQQLVNLRKYYLDLSHRADREPAAHFVSLIKGRNYPRTVMYIKKDSMLYQSIYPQLL